MTGNPIPGAPTAIEARQAELDQVLAAVLPPARTNGVPPARPTVPALPDDHELLERARAASNGATFEGLWRGELNGHPSRSEADPALCNLLAFWAGPDPTRIDRLFRSSGLMRDKWDTPRGDSTYGAQTIARALEGRTEFFEPRPPRQTAPPAREVSSASSVPSKPEATWPDPPGAGAFYGLAGEVVRAIEPHSEADAAALLSQFLVAFGNACGRGAGIAVEGSLHPTALYLWIVGPTAKGRKGTSWGRIRQLLELVDRRWVTDCIADGLSTGEGLIHAVRDP